MRWVIDFLEGLVGDSSEKAARAAAAWNNRRVNYYESLIRVVDATDLLARGWDRRGTNRESWHCREVFKIFIGIAEELVWNKHTENQPKGAVFYTGTLVERVLLFVQTFNITRRVICRSWRDISSDLEKSRG